MRNRISHLIVILLMISTISAVLVSFPEMSDGASYTIGSGDILGITTWREPNFTRSDILVRIDGRISFPLLGEIEASGLTPLELSEKVKTGLAEYVSNPVVTVSVINSRSEKFYVLGEVMRPGEYEIKKDITVLQALALAGGLTEWASKREILLLRYDGRKDKMLRIEYTDPTTSSIKSVLLDREGKEDVIRIRYNDIVKGKDLSQNVRIKANDTIIVP